jgi:hypothetical protein
MRAGCRRPCRCRLVSEQPALRMVMDSEPPQHEDPDQRFCPSWQRLDCTFNPSRGGSRAAGLLESAPRSWHSVVAGSLARHTAAGAPGGVHVGARSVGVRIAPRDGNESKRSTEHTEDAWRTPVLSVLLCFSRAPCSGPYALPPYNRPSRWPGRMFHCGQRNQKEIKP